MINRRNFLALIPSLSAIPLIGKDIIQDKEKITIIKPEPIRIEQPSLTSFDMRRCRVQVVYDDGQVLGEGYLTQMSMEHSLYGYRSIEISAQLQNFHLSGI